jgi:hypothetical protein
MKKPIQTRQEWIAYQREWLKTPRGRYSQHKGKAVARGIEWRLTFEDWWDIWQTSGKWNLRGRYAHQYVMARYGDRGPYARDNVRICLSGENTEEMRRGLPPRGRQTLDEKRAANREYRQRQRIDLVRVRPATSEAAFGRRMVVREGQRCWAHPGDVDYPG